MQAFREGLGKGDKVVTSGGIYGTVRDVKETYFVVEISDGVRIRVDKNFVYPGPAEAQAEPKKEEGK